MKSSAAYSFGLLAAFCAGLVGAQEAPATDAAGERIEEITVTGQRSLFDLRMKVSEAEDAMYALFNELNTDDKYDVVCKIEIRYFSHIKQKRCLPQYALDALMDAAQGMARGQAQGLPQEAVIARETPVLEAKFQELVGKNPELFDAMAKHYELSEALRLRRKTYFGPDSDEEGEAP
jgi:hypothetical protein